MTTSWDLVPLKVATMNVFCFFFRGVIRGSELGVSPLGNQKDTEAHRGRSDSRFGTNHHLTVPSGQLEACLCLGFPLGVAGSRMIAVSCFWWVGFSVKVVSSYNTSSKDLRPSWPLATCLGCTMQFFQARTRKFRPRAFWGQ